MGWGEGAHVWGWAHRRDGQRGVTGNEVEASNRRLPALHLGLDALGGGLHWVRGGSAVRRGRHPPGML